jgi:hypothetical protein
MVQPELRNKLDQLRDLLLNSDLVAARKFYLIEINGDPNEGDMAVKAAFLQAEGRSAIDFVDGVSRNFEYHYLEGSRILPNSVGGVYLPAYRFLWGRFQVNGRGKGQLFYFLADGQVLKDGQGLVIVEWTKEQPVRQWGFRVTSENRLQWPDDNGPGA